MFAYTLELRAIVLLQAIGTAHGLKTEHPNREEYRPPARLSAAEAWQRLQWFADPSGAYAAASSALVAADTNEGRCSEWYRQGLNVYAR